MHTLSLLLALLCLAQTSGRQQLPGQWKQTRQDINALQVRLEKSNQPSDRQIAALLKATLAHADKSTLARRLDAIAAKDHKELQKIKDILAYRAEFRAAREEIAGLIPPLLGWTGKDSTLDSPGKTLRILGILHSVLGLLAKEQRSLYEAVRDLEASIAGRPDKKPAEADRQALKKLAARQAEARRRCAALLPLCRLDSGADTFLQVLQAAETDLRHVAARLERGDLDRLTLQISKEAVETMRDCREAIEAIFKRRTLKLPQLSIPEACLEAASRLIRLDDALQAETKNIPEARP